jgi:hypothetical protein
LVVRERRSLRKEELEEELTSSRNWAGIDRNCEL